MRAGKVDLLVIMGGNPVYDAPADLGFADALKSSRHLVAAFITDSTRTKPPNYCHWHVNENALPEVWSDARAYDGTVSIVQPLIAPLYAGKSGQELVAALVGSFRHSPASRSGPRVLAEAALRARTSKISGASRCTMVGSKAPRYAPKSISAKGAHPPSAF